jgi:hypothetical protein
MPNIFRGQVSILPALSFYLAEDGAYSQRQTKGDCFKRIEPMDTYFTRVPDALYDAIKDGELNALMFNIMMHLHHWADWNTGVVRTVNAKRLRSALGGNHDDDVAAERSIQRAMQGLDEAGWIISGYKQGSKLPYSVQLTNYQPVADAGGEMAVIIPMDTKHWRETAAFQGADAGGEQALMQAVKRRLKKLDSIQESSDENPNENLPTTFNQPINQPTDRGAADAAPLTASLKKEKPHGRKGMDESWTPEFRAWLKKEISFDFPGNPCTDEDLRMYGELKSKLDERAIDFWDIVEFNSTHMPKKMWISNSLRQAHKAIVLGDPENGLVMQFLIHGSGPQDDCKKCESRIRRRLDKAEQKMEEAAPCLSCKKWIPEYPNKYCLSCREEGLDKAEPVTPFDYEPDADDAVSVPREETPTPSAAPAAGWALQCERCKREVTIPPSYDKTGWNCDRAKHGCGAENKIPMEILAQISVSRSKNSEQYFPQAAD